ncbi:MAG TPA: hypothetical protein VGL23_13450 [Chloroflexota bacterium]|jgi:hypothetical protein
MKRARYLVFFELCFVGLLCLGTFLFALFALGGDEIGLVATLLGLAQIGLAFVTLLVTHLTLRTVFRRGARYQASTIAESAAFKAVPVVIVAIGLFHMLLLQVLSPGVAEFGWDFTRRALLYVFALALGWHIATSWLLHRAAPEPEADEPG